MENNQHKSIFELNLTEDGKTSLSGIAQWAYINAIVGFISIGISIVSMVTVISSFGRYGSSSIVGTTVFSTLVGVIISLLLNITLISASSLIKKGLASAEQSTFNRGITKLTSYFRILGIIIIVIMVIVFLFILIMSLAGASGKL